MRKYFKNPKVIMAVGVVAGYYLGRNWDFNLKFNANKRNVPILPEVNVNG